jgi:quinol monooxygenase YgiN
MKTYLNAGAIAALLITGAAATQASAATEPVTVVTYIDAIPDVFVAQNEEQAQVLLKQMNADTQKEPGLISFTILRETGRPNHFTLLEVWQDEAAFAAHLASPHTRQFRKDLQPHIGSPYDTLVTTETKAD